MESDDQPWQLTLGALLKDAGINPDDVLAIRHTFTAAGLGSRNDATPERILTYTREQNLAPGKLPAQPPRWWLIFVAESGLRCRLVAVYDNQGEIAHERTETHRFFDLHPSPVFSPLQGRLLIQWSADAVNWAKTGGVASTFPVMEIADPQIHPFPGYHEFVLTYSELQQVVTDSRYVRWQAALGAVQGVYVIADTSSGQLYVGKADGHERILGRWIAYATDGHGGNAALHKLMAMDAGHPRHYRFSLLQAFPPHTPQAEVNRAESHYKRALLTRTFGLNRN